MDRTANCLTTSVTSSSAPGASPAAGAARSVTVMAAASSAAVPSARGCRQACAWPGATSASGGSVSWQSDSAKRQRGAKRHMTGSPISFGGVPGMVARVAVESRSMVGIDSNSASV